MINARNFCVKVVVQTMSLLTGYSAVAQHADTTYIISSTDEQYVASPFKFSNSPFYNLIRPDKPGLRPTILYSSDDRIFVGVNYNILSKNWKPDSSGQKHRLYSNYSFNQRAFSVGYQGIFHNAISHWDLFVDANYDWIKWMNFSGVGNETIQQNDNRNFYRIRSREATVSASLHRKVGKQSNFTITPFYQRIQLIDDADRILKNFFNEHLLANYQAKDFAGLTANLQLQRLNDLLLPTKGVIVSTAISHVRNVNQPRFFTNYSIYSRLFLPILNHFVFSVENGAATVIGEPEFYQLNSIGGNTLRGYRRQRFWGETIFHNNNELQYVFDVDSKLFKGKLGLLGFVDQGRVWKKGEQSDLWHRSYGAGIMVVPYHKLYLSVQYGISPERGAIHFEFRRSL